MGVLCRTKTRLGVTERDEGKSDRIWFERLNESVYAWLRAAPEREFEFDGRIDPNPGPDLDPESDSDSYPQLDSDLVAHFTDLTHRTQVLDPIL